MIPYHYYAELALWMAAMFLAGCPLGAFARWLSDRWRKGPRAGAAGTATSGAKDVLG